MKKVKVNPGQIFPTHILEVNGEDGPQYSLLELIDNSFSSRLVSEITPTTANYPRKTELAKGNVDVLTASTKEGWGVKQWPFSIFVDDQGNESLFDHRHLLRAVKANNYLSVPVALYRRKKTGNDLYDSLSNNSVLSLMGLFVNATDGTTNAVQNDFVNVVKLVIEDEGLPFTKDNAQELLEVCGIQSRYAHKPVITAIENAILDRKTKSTKVFNTTKEEIKEWMNTRPFFGSNNYSSVDGVATRHKVLDSQFTYRYAGDILKWAFAAWKKGETVRVLCNSYAEHESEIESEREEIIEVMKDIFSQPINFYCEKLRAQFGGMINPPTISLDELPLELWAAPQIEGEGEAIQLL
jgi:hypothetical protein